MKSVLAAMALLLLAARPAVSQTDAPPSAHQRELARQLMTEMHFERQMEAMTQMMAGAMAASLKSAAPGADQTKSADMMASMQEEMRDITPRIETMAVDLYAREFTEKELVDTVAFYQTESGKAVLEKMPDLTQKMGPMMFKLIPEMQAGMLHRYCLKATCTKEEKALLAKLSATH